MRRIGFDGFVACSTPWVDLPAGERRAALEAMADSDPGLVREVSAIIDEAEKTSPGLATGGSPYPSAIDAAAGLVGQKLGHYEIIRLVGLGGMGAVYEALRVEDGYQRRVAIKLVRTEFNQAPTLARFQARAADPGPPATSQHRHPA
jgi:serine/threonine protein kinase